MMKCLCTSLHRIRNTVEPIVIWYSLCVQSVKVLKEGVKKLPIAIEDTYIYQEAQVLTIESARGFSMQCNFKFDVCTVTLSGKMYLCFISL
jgi:hypothetical protein